MILKIEEKFKKGKFRINNLSLVHRSLLLILVAIGLAQSLTTTIWYQHSRQQNLVGIEATSVNMANMFASTTTFFKSLPIEYRHIVLDQIRNMGGAQYFVSFNSQPLNMQGIEDSNFKQVAIDAVETVLRQKLPDIGVFDVDFIAPEHLKIFKDDIYLRELPKSWLHHTLSVPLIDPPVLVVQIPVDSSGWLYIAAILPSPYMMLGADLISFDQLLFLASSTSLLLLLTYLMIRRQVRPLKQLAKAANTMSIDSNRPPLIEEGASELVSATRAFNHMQQRIRLYIQDRESLFTSISHDLKTPITRLRLRAELLESDTKRRKFTQDLDDLEMMVKGALQCVRETDLHENAEQLDLQLVVESIAEPYNQYRNKVHLPTRPIPMIYGRPLAMKRVLSNLIENGVRYGGEVTIRWRHADNGLVIWVSDRGPGIPAEHLEQVFEPYFRLRNDNEGHGLGLGICRNILHAHGGDLILHNRKNGGLSALAIVSKGM